MIFLYIISVLRLKLEILSSNSLIICFKFSDRPESATNSYPNIFSLGQQQGMLMRILPREPQQ